jgi:DNA-binding GntR family transcriptional regulator
LLDSLLELLNNVAVLEQQLKTVSTVDAIADALRTRILDGSIAPGTPLREAQWAEEFGVARHSFRAATQQLIHQGLLRHAPNRGVQVPELGASDVEDVFHLRSALEHEALRMVVERGEVPADAVTAVEQLLALPADAPWHEVVLPDMAFHRALIQATGSSRLIRAYAAVQSEIEFCLVQLRPMYDRPAQVAEEHRELLEPIAAHDLERADRLLRVHLDEARDNLLHALDRPSPEADPSPETTES